MIPLTFKPKETLFEAVRRAMFNATTNLKIVQLSYQDAKVLVYPYENKDVPIVMALKISLTENKLARITK